MKTKSAQTLILLLAAVPGLVFASNDHGTGAPQTHQASQELLLNASWWQWLLQAWPW